MTPFRILNENLAVFAGIVVSLGAIFAVPPLRRLVLAAWGAIKGYATGPLLLKEMVAEVRSIREDVSTVKREVQVNGGGSMKDSLARLELGQARSENFRQHDFWTQGRPAMELDGHGQVNLVSEAMVRLFHVSTPEDLYRRSWLRFLDGEDVTDFIESFVRTAKSDSRFRFAIRIRGNANEDRGEWEFRAQPIKPDIGGEKLYSGHWVPIDETAKAVADRNRWAN